MLASNTEKEVGVWGGGESEKGGKPIKYVLMS